jgi:hypothetical protein
MYELLVAGMYDPFSSLLGWVPFHLAQHFSYLTAPTACSATIISDSTSDTDCNEQLLTHNP